MKRCVSLHFTCGDTEQEHKQKQQAGPNTDTTVGLVSGCPSLRSCENTDLLTLLSCSSRVGADEATLFQTPTRCWFCSHLSPSSAGAVVPCHRTHRVLSALRRRFQIPNWGAFSKRYSS